MNVLAIETSGPIGSVAAGCDEKILSEATLEHPMEHDRLLLPLIDQIVRESGWNKNRDIELIAISAGPGSFTGLRIGITCAKTIAAHLGKPLIAVCSFDALAENAPADCSRIITALDAKRGDVYAAAYERNKDKLTRVCDPFITTPDKAAILLPAPCLVIGDALQHHAETLCANGSTPADETLWRIRAATVARLGLAAYNAGQRDNTLTLEPIYLRLPEAEEKRLARERDGA